MAWLVKRICRTCGRTFHFGGPAAPAKPWPEECLECLIDGATDAELGFDD